MSEELAFALCIIKVLCLLSIAMSLSKLAGGREYAVGDRSADSSNPSGNVYKQGKDTVLQQERSSFMGDGQVEAPVFYNIGSVRDTNALLQAAANAPEALYDLNSVSGYQAAAADVASGKLPANFLHGVPVPSAIYGVPGAASGYIDTAAMTNKSYAQGAKTNCLLYPNSSDCKSKFLGGIERFAGMGL